jgi:tetratricopeptide (TPR) repeat protein
MAATSLNLGPRKAHRKAVLLHSEAVHLASRGRHREAAKSYRRALRLAYGLRSADPLFRATLLNDFGVLCKFMGRFALAESMYQRALRTLGKSSNHKDPLATLYHNLAGLDHARGHYHRALRLARYGIALRKSVRPRDSMSLLADEAALAAILADLGRTAEAAKIYRRILRHCRRNRGLRRWSRKDSRNYEIGSLRGNLGALYAKTGRLGAAEHMLRQALSVLETELGRNHPRIVSALNNLAVVCARRGRVREADMLYHRALRLLAMLSGRTYPPASVVRQNYRELRLLDQ